MFFKTGMFSIPLMFVVMSASFNVSAAQMKTYEFTSSFTECVKAQTSENTKYTTSGLAESALMNGSSVMNGSSIDGSYWTYMNCLDSSSSDTANSSSDTGTSCPSFIVSYNGTKLRVPPALPGKTISIKGLNYQCVDGSWQKNTTENYGLPTIANDCSSTTIEISQCSFSLPEAASGRYSTVTYRSNSGTESSSFYDGEAVALCENGDYTIVSSTCEVQTCQQSVESSWSSTSSTSSYSGTTQGALCTGTIDAYGYAYTETPELRYFSGLDEAQEKTAISVGEARYYCTNNTWKELASTCRLKQSQELSCSSRKDANGNYEYACQ